jgi:hypothetical protein
VSERPAWLEGLTHKDWMLDGYPIRSERAIERFNQLDWSQAWIDMGPSIAGNLGPYWHVPLPEEETVHRLYPRVLLTKWLPVIRQACEEAAAKAARSSSPEFPDNCLQNTTQEKT